MIHEKREWIRLLRGNDWGVEYFYRPDRPKSHAGTYSKDSGVDFIHGQGVMVRWPDGSQSTETVTLQSKHGHVYDHGHSYDVSFMLPGIEVTARLGCRLVGLPEAPSAGATIQ